MPDNDNDRYLQGRFEVEGRDFVDAGLVSSRIKKGLKAKGINEDIIRRIAVIAFEASPFFIPLETRPASTKSRPSPSKLP